MERTPRLILIVVLSILGGAGLLFYAYVQSKDFLRGPIVTITEPLPGSQGTTSFTTIIGAAHNVAFMTLNGRQIFTNEYNRFKEPLLLQEGYNIIAIDAKDRFGHNTQKKLELVYTPTATSTFIIPEHSGIKNQ